MLDGVVAFLALVTVIYAGPLLRVPREAEDYQAMDAYTNFTANEVCFSDNQVFQRGDLVPNPGPCEECLCEPPSIVCNMVRCPVNTNGCRTIQRPNQCCPEYICECEYNGRIINDGARIDTPDEPCQVCYCKGGDIMCNSVTCYTRDDCSPIVVPGQCCPKYENCPIRDSDGISDNNRVSNKTVNHGVNKDMQPWLLTKTVSQPHVSSPPKAHETPALVTTENGDVVIVSDWLTERKLMTDDLSSSVPITSHAVLPDPTRNPGSASGSLFPKPQRDGNGMAVVKTGETVAPEEVIFTRVDLLKDNHGGANHVTTILPVIHVDAYGVSRVNENTSLRPSVTATPTTTTFKPSTVILDDKSGSFNEDTTETHPDILGNINEKTGDNDDLNISPTVNPYIEATTDNKFSAIDLIPESEEMLTASDSYNSNESSTVYSVVDSISQDSKVNENATFLKGVVKTEETSGVLNLSDMHNIQPTDESRSTEETSTEIFLGQTVTAEDLLNILETTTIPPISVGQVHSSMEINSSFVVKEEKDIDSSTEYPDITEQVKSDTEEFEEPLSKPLDFVKPIKVKKDFLKSNIEYTTDNPTTVHEEGVDTSMINTESILQKDIVDIPHSLPESTLSKVSNNGVNLEQKLAKNGNQSEYKHSDTSEKEGMSLNKNESLVVSNRTLNAIPNETMIGSSSTPKDHEPVTQSYTLLEHNDLLTKIRISLSQTDGSGNAPPVIDLNGAVPFLQLGGPVLSESDVEDMEELVTTTITTEDPFGKLGDTDNQQTNYTLPNGSHSTLDKTTAPTVILDDVITTPSPILSSELKINSDKKSYKLDSSKEIISTHIPLTPGDLRVIAEYLINKKIKPASNEHDEYTTNEWLKGNLTSEEKITSILSAANVSIGIMNYTKPQNMNPKPVSNQVKVEKYEKDDIFKGNSILGKGNSLVNKTGYLHDKYVEDSTKAYERTQNFKLKENVNKLSNPTTNIFNINSSSTPIPAVAYTTLNSLKNLLNYTQRTGDKVTTPFDRNVNTSAVLYPQLNNSTSHKSNMTRAETERISSTNNHSTVEENIDSPFSLTRFISSFFAEEDLTSRGLQKPMIP